MLATAFINLEKSVMNSIIPGRFRLFLNMEAIQDFEDTLSRIPGVQGFETMIISKAYRKNPWILAGPLRNLP